GSRGAVHQDVDRAETAYSGIDEVAHRLRARRVHRDGDDSARGFPSQLLGGGFQRAHGACRNHDRDAFGGQFAGGLLADADAATGNDRDFTRQSQIQTHAFTSFFQLATFSSMSARAPLPKTAVTRSCADNSVIPVQLPLDISWPRFRPSPRRAS